MKQIIIKLLLISLFLFYPTKTYDSFTGATGEMMLDTNGVAIQAHGGQIQKLGDTYYWIGEDKTNDYKPCPGIHMYTSKDLYNWNDAGLVLKTLKEESEMDEDYFKQLYGELSDDQRKLIYEDLWQGTDGVNGCVIERPKMLYNKKTNKYVIWFHADGTTPSSTSGSNYAKAKAGVAISDSPLGPFKLLGTYMLISDDNYDHSWDHVGGHLRDMNLFQDDDGTAYVIYSSDGNTNTYIAKLSDDYTELSKTDGVSVEGKDYIVTFIRLSREAPAMFKYNNQYYMINSGCTGWNPNPANYAIADKVLGKWEVIGNPCVDDGASTTYDTQSTCVFKINEGEYVYMGDRWKSSYLRDSRYVWLPIEFDVGGYISIKKRSNWNLDIFKTLKPFYILTNLPTRVDSVENLKKKLPSNIDIQYVDETDIQNVNIEWNLNNIDYNSIADIEVIGTLENGKEIKHSVYIINPNTIYFFDCSAEQYSPGVYYTLLSSSVLLLNSNADQSYKSGSQAGYSSVLGGTNDSCDISTKSGGGNDIWSKGFWAHSGKTIDYKFELEAGSYVVNEGFYEWWNTSRGLKITVKSDSGEITSKSFTLGNGDTMNQQSLSFKLSKAQTVTVSVSKTGGADPVLSWIGVIKN